MENKKNDLENYISSLSENEQEKFKDLIEECRQREKDITGYSEKTKKNIQILANVMTNIVKDLNIMLDNIQKTNQTLMQVKEEQKEIQNTKFLENLPDDKFFKV